MGGRDILVDARCLQDPLYAGRGIGRLAAALLQAGRESVAAVAGARWRALTDPALPALAPAVRGLFDAATTIAAPAVAGGWLVSLSPLTHDPLATARLVADPAVLSAAVVYDFIPLDDAARTPPRAGQRLAYRVGLTWLARHDFLAPISAATAARAGEVLAGFGGTMRVIGAPLQPCFRAARRAPPAARHVLVVGGGDPRKNVECAVSAHALWPGSGTVPVPLIVTGEYGPDWQAGLRARHAAAGGAAALLRFPGVVSDAALAALYADALAVAVPSWAEGFSLPVIEAMAAGAPVVASAIPAHQALLPDLGFLFPPGEPAALAALLGRIGAEPGCAAALRAAQDTVWPRYEAAAVAERFWGALAAAEPRPRLSAVHRGARPSLALLSPLPPAATGIAATTAAICRALGRRVDLHLFTPTPEPAPVAGAASLQPLSALAHLSPRFDRVVSVIGNSGFHDAILRLLCRHGGAAIVHDPRMLLFYLYIRGMAAARGRAGAELGRAVTVAEIASWADDESRLPTLFLSEVAGAATPLLVHSGASARAIAAAHGVAPVVLPFPLCRLWSDEDLAPAARAAARARLGIGGAEIAIASFGGVASSKGAETLVWALDLLRGWGVPARLLLVGAARGREAAGARALAARLGRDAQVAFHDRAVAEDAWRDHLLAADLVVQLRGFDFGQVSGALADAIAAGIPGVANAGLAAALAAPATIRRVPDRLSPVLVAEALADLIGAGAQHERRRPERLVYQRDHAPEAYAQPLLAALGLEA